MPSSVINSDDGVISGTSGIKTTGGDDGVLKIQTNGTDAASVTSGQVFSFVNNFGTVANLPAYQCRAWVNFNGTGTVAIREDGNVSSITDNGTGDYTVNFTTAMPDANYSTVATTTMQNGDVNIINAGLRTSPNDTVTTYTTSAVRVAVVFAASGNGYVDRSYVLVSIFR
jgi:hypothetical protein